MAGFDNDVMYADNVDFSGTSPVSGQFNADGQILIGSTASPNVKVGTIGAGTGISVTNGSGTISISVDSTVATTFSNNTDTIQPSGNTVKLVAGSNISVTKTASDTFSIASTAAPSPLTTKGDLYTYDTGDARLGVGADNLPLVANSSEATGLNWAALTETGGGTGQTTYTQGDILYSDGSDSLAKLGVGGDGDFIAYSGSAPVAFNQSNYIWHFDDAMDDALYKFSTSGTGANAGGTTGVAGHPGMFIINPGTTTTGKASLLIGNSTKMILSGGKIVYRTAVQISDLATAAQDYLLWVGMMDKETGGLTDGAYFKYDRSTSVNWRYATSNGGSETIASSSTAVATGWTSLRIEVNAGATSVEFFVDDVSLGTSATNIPTGALSQGMSVEKTAGTTGRVFNYDYYSFFQILTTSR